MDGISEKIAKLRKESGYSQDDLARRVGVVRQTISRWEAGIALPGTVELMSLCNIFGVGMDYFRSDGGETDFFAVDATQRIESSVSSGANRRSAAPYLCGIILFTLCVGILSVIAVYIGVAVYKFNPEWILFPPRYSYKFWLLVCIILWFADVVADGMCIFMTVKVVKGNHKD